MAAQSVVVVGPNVRFRHGATFEVHAAGCADLARGVLRVSTDAMWQPMPLETVAELVEAIYPSDDFDYDPVTEAGSYAEDIHLAPCVHLAGA